eukprot:gene1555-biopygen10985
MLREAEAEGSDGGGGRLGVIKSGWLRHPNLITPSPSPPPSDPSASASRNIYGKGGHQQGNTKFIPVQNPFVSDLEQLQFVSPNLPSLQSPCLLHALQEPPGHSSLQAPPAYPDLHSSQSVPAQ